MVCTDRQLTPAQLEAGFNQSRAGVVRALRPISGQPSLEALYDYIQRELTPAVQQQRKAINEIWSPVVDSAPSANPLSFYFSTNTANADPTVGRMRLNQAVQNTATTLRLSELNYRQINAEPWLSVMQSSITTPMGVITMADSKDPGRFIRANLTSMVDQGAYWDLGISVVESSHPNPFVEGEQVLVGFIAGVADGGVSIATNVAAIRGVSAGTQLLTSGTLSLANSNGVSFGLNSGTLTASYAREIGIVSHVGGNSQSAVSRLVFQNSGAISWSLVTGASIVSVRPVFNGLAISAGTTQGTGTFLEFDNQNGVSFGVFPFGATQIITASIASSLTGINVSAGTTSNNLSALVFSNDQNVSWGLSGSTVTANASQRYFGLPGAVDGAAFSFVNTGGLSWSVSSFTFANAGKTQTGAQYTPTLGAFLTTESQLGLVSHVGGNQVSSVTRLAFSNASNVTFSLSTAAGAATVIASVAAGGAGGIGAVSASNFGGSISSGTLVFSNAGVYTAFNTGVSDPNVMFSLSGSTLVASALIGFADSLGPFVATQISFSNANSISWGMSTTTIAAGRAVIATASYLPQIGLVSHVGGNSITAVTRLAFSNASNVTFSLSTAVNAATLLASVAAQSAQTFIGGIAGGTQTATSGTIVFSNSNDFTFGLSGSTRMTASYLPQIGLVSHVGGNQVSSVTRLAFSNASNVTFSLSTAANAATLLASVAAAGGGGIQAVAAAGVTQSSGTVIFSNATFLTAITSASNSPNVQWSLDSAAGSMQATAFMKVTANVTTTGGFAVTKLNFVDGGGIQWGVATSNDAEGRGVQVTAQLPAINLYMNNGVGSGYIALLRSTSLWVSPFLYPMPGRITADTFEMLVQGAAATGTPGSFGYTLRGGVYTLNNSTQLTLVNSFSLTRSSTSQASSAWNNLFPGDRYLTVASSLWSSQPAFSAGVQYWLGLIETTGGTAMLANWLGNRFFQIAGTGFRGDIGVSHAAASSHGHEPFFGFVNTTGIPVSIGTAGVTGAGPTYSAALPMFNLRQGLFRGP